MLRFPNEFFESVVDTYWGDLNYAGQKLAGAYTDLVTVPPNGQLPLSAQVSRELASKQVNVYLFELIGLFLRKEGKCVAKDHAARQVLHQGQGGCLTRTRTKRVIGMPLTVIGNIIFVCHINCFFTYFFKFKFWKVNYSSNILPVLIQISYIPASP